MSTPCPFATFCCSETQPARVWYGDPVLLSRRRTFCFPVITVFHSNLVIPRIFSNWILPPVPARSAPSRRALPSVRRLRKRCISCRRVFRRGSPRERVTASCGASAPDGVSSGGGTRPNRTPPRLADLLPRRTDAAQRCRWGRISGQPPVEGWHLDGARGGAR